MSPRRHRGGRYLKTLSAKDKTAAHTTVLALETWIAVRDNWPQTTAGNPPASFWAHEPVVPPELRSMRAGSVDVRDLASDVAARRAQRHRRLEWLRSQGRDWRDLLAEVEDDADWLDDDEPEGA